MFDSGVGGLAVLQLMRKTLPEADLLYLADRANAPYGSRSIEEVAELSLSATEFLLLNGADTVVVACNTASAAALEVLRDSHPGTPFVGMEPAVKPAAKISNTGVIAVFATAVTFQGRLFESLIEKHATDLQVLRVPCPGWVGMVEAGIVDGKDAEASVRSTLDQVLAEGADTVVLGCTHFSFLSGLIEELGDGRVQVVDPAGAVAAQAARVAKSKDGNSSLKLVTSGPAEEFDRLVGSLTDLDRFLPALPLLP